MKILDNKRILITGGTGSLGKVLVRRILSGEFGEPEQVVVFSRDEAKQHAMRVAYLNRTATTDEVIYNNFKHTLKFLIGDIRDYHSVSSALNDVDIVFNAAALKQVPTCEYHPYQALMTNIVGPENIVLSIQEHKLPVEIVVGVSTDKACKPVNVMGMTKAIQERLFIKANLTCQDTRFVCVRYGNVLASRGSVVPLFHEQIRSGGPVTITDPKMTRFLLSLNQAVDTIFAAVQGANRGETYIPKVPSALITDLAECLIGKRSIPIKVTGIRPGEKLHEILVSEEEMYRTVDRGQYYAILPMLPELRDSKSDQEQSLNKEFSSADHVMTRDELTSLLNAHNLMVPETPLTEEEYLV